MVSKKIEFGLEKSNLFLGTRKIGFLVKEKSDLCSLNKAKSFDLKKIISSLFFENLKKLVLIYKRSNLFCDN